MLQNQPITAPLFQTSLRSWRAKYVAQQQAQAAEQAAQHEQAEQPAEPKPEAAGPSRVKKLSPRRRKKRQAALSQD